MNLEVFVLRNLEGPPIANHNSHEGTFQDSNLPDEVHFNKSRIVQVFHPSPNPKVNQRSARNSTEGDKKRWKINIMVLRFLATALCKFARKIVFILSVVYSCLPS